uniref:Reverse transcriptase zinc-binding domain-containing protein n=1 Tax=Setaria italica TaxID=4555 RepID=K3YY75_SETIT
MASSTEPKRREKLYRNIWKADVRPPKARMFAWRLASNALASNTNKKTRHNIEDDTCTICGLEPKDAAHAVAGCSRARALLTEIRHRWAIPEISQLQYTGSEWFLLTLNNTPENARPALILFLWRNWSVHNDLTHGGTYFSVAGSVRVIESMLNNLSIQHSDVFMEDVKGKRVIGESKKAKEIAANEIARASRLVPTWNPPARMVEIKCPIILESYNSTCIRSLTLGERDRSSSASWITNAREHMSRIE